jgi:hypothetical protein
MFTGSEKKFIEMVKGLPETTRNSKSVAKQFQSIKNRVTGEKDDNCMCGMVYRKIYIKDFLTWYEDVAR